MILLGQFKGEKLAQPWHVVLRVSPGKEYVKVIVKGGRVQGAVLIGDTDLEETMQNLILDAIDISEIENDLLDPEIDLDDYFD